MGNVAWIGTPQGLYQYNQSEDSFTKFPLPGRNKDTPVKLLYLYREWLWCILDTGVAALHVQLNDWLFFDRTKNLPSDRVRRLDFQEDFVWAATDSGLARFDLMIEQWETIGTSRGLPNTDVADIRVAGTSAWSLNGPNLSEYDPSFEKWRHFPLRDDSTGALQNLFLLGGDLWIVAEKGLLRFDPRLQNVQPFLLPFLASSSLIELYAENTRLWAVTRQGLYMFEQESGVWREFEGNSGLPSVALHFGQVDAQKIWVLGENVTMLWDRTLKTWTILDYSNGLSSNTYASVSSEGELTMLFTADGMEYRRVAREPWRRRELVPFAPSGNATLKRLFDNPEGGSIELGDYVWGWQGTRIAWLHDQTFYPLHETSSLWRFDVKSLLTASNSRRVNGFHNNVDYEETKYGVRFRGDDSDLVREVNWGDFRREAGNNPFMRPSEMFGGGVWIEQGKKTERFRKSLVSARAATGEVRSRNAYEHFRGASVALHRSVRDVDYAARQFYVLPGLDSGAAPEGLQLYVDDLAPWNNTPRTTVGAFFAGVKGDYDEWVPVEGFSFVQRMNCLRLMKPVQPGWIVVARYSTGGAIREEILQDGSASRALTNVYALGAKQILPYTARVTIADSTGRSTPLSAFGLDDDRDGVVDGSRIDHEEGFLWFPMPHPFPSEVYDPAAPRSIYRILLVAETRLPSIQLSHRNLVRGSETVSLDAIPARPGDDYVLDYTNGTLIFVREEAVSSDTRIEVEYQYYDPLDGRVLESAIALSPSDDLLIQGEWQHLTEDSTHLLTFHSEVRRQVGEFDLRIIPGAAYQTAERKLTAGSAEALVSSPWLRLRSRYETYDRDYRNLYTPTSVVGKVRERLNVYGVLDLREDLRLTAEANSVEGGDSAGGVPRDRTVGAALLYHAPGLPGVQVSYQSAATEAGDTTVSKHVVQGQLEYQLPRSWMESAGMRSMRLEFAHRTGGQSISGKGGYRKDGFQQTSYRLNAQVRDQVSAGFFYRTNSVDDVTGSTPVSRVERLLADLYVGEWRTLQLSLRMENTLQQESHGFSPLVDYTLRLFHQINVRFSPGQLWEPLSTLFFEVNHNRTVGETGRREGRSSASLWRFAPSAGAESGSLLHSINSYVKNEFRPGVFWLCTTLMEWGNTESALGSTALRRTNWQFTEKADVRVALTTRLTGQYRQSFVDAGQNRTTAIVEPSVWVEERWTEDLLSTVQLLYRRTTAHTDQAEGVATDWGGYLDMTFRKDSWALMRHVELRQSVSASVRTSHQYPRQRNLLVATTTSMDLYPVQALIVRLRLDWNGYRDEISPAGGYDTVLGSLKVSLQL